MSRTWVAKIRVILVGDSASIGQRKQQRHMDTSHNDDLACHVEEAGIRVGTALPPSKNHLRNIELCSLEKGKMGKTFGRRMGRFPDLWMIWLHAHQTRLPACFFWRRLLAQANPKGRRWSQEAVQPTILVFFSATVQHSMTPDDTYMILKCVFVHVS